jgi:hypothetical protein
LNIFDVIGGEVTVLLDGNLKAGELHSVAFDASHLASGMGWKSAGTPSRGNNAPEMILFRIYRPFYFHETAFVV